MRKKVIITIGWLITVALFYLLLRNINVREIASNLSDMKAWPIVAAVFMNFGVVIAKSLRWYILTNPDQRTSFGRTVDANIIGMTGNNLLPARAGDIMKVFLLGKWSGMSKLGLAILAGLDKLFDLLTFAALALYLFLTKAAPKIADAGLKALVAMLIVGIIIAVAIILSHKYMPRSWSLREYFSRLVSGLDSLRDKKRTAQCLIISVASTAMQIATLLLCQRALSVNVNLATPMLAFLAVNVAVAIPSAPSNLGPFEFAVVLTYGLFGIDKAIGLNIALMYHAVQIIPVTLIGLMLTGKLGLKFKTAEDNQPSSISLDSTGRLSS